MANAANAASRKYYSIEELARVSGASEITLRRLWREGKIPGFQPGGPNSRIFFPTDALETGAARAASETAGSAKSAAAPSGNGQTAAAAGTRSSRARWRRQAIALDNAGVR